MGEHAHTNGRSATFGPFPEQPVQVRVWRGPEVESQHRGAWALVDPSGAIQASSGDVRARFYARSSIKCLQALPLLESGAAERFRLDARELALALASHDGERRHTETVEGLLARLDLSERDLRCGPQRPRDREAREVLAASGLTASPLHNNCSGKHAGFLTLARHLDADPARYLERDEPVQRAAAQAVGELCDLDSSALEHATDGCSAPTFRLPLVALATAFARVANPASLADPRARACRAMTEAAAAHPELVAGSRGRLCTDLLRASRGRLFAKVGAEAVYAIGVRDAGLGLAVKLDDGGQRGLAPLVLGLLERFDLLSASEREALATWRPGATRNWAGLEVGRIEVVS